MPAPAEAVRRPRPSTARPEATDDPRPSPIPRSLLTTAAIGTALPRPVVAGIAPTRAVMSNRGGPWAVYDGDPADGAGLKGGPHRRPGGRTDHPVIRSS